MMMRMVSRFAVIHSLLAVAAGAQKYPSYRVVIAEIPGSGSGINGTAVVFTDSTTCGYAGIVQGLMPNLVALNCTATNGCGVHIHNGTSCNDTTTQGGHYFASPVTVDPWTESRYSSDANGTANFMGILDIGTDNVEGRPFLGTYKPCASLSMTMLSCM